MSSTTCGPSFGVSGVSSLIVVLSYGGAHDIALSRTARRRAARPRWPVVANGRRTTDEHAGAKGGCRHVTCTLPRVCCDAERAGQAVAGDAPGCAWRFGLY